MHTEELGLCLQTASGVTGAAIAPNSKLLDLAKTAARSLVTVLTQRGLAEPVQRMTLLWLPQRLVAADYPGRHQLLAGGDMVAQALAGLKVTLHEWREDRAGRINLMAFSALHVHNQGPGGMAPRPGAGNIGGTPVPAGPVRRAFRAGTFYPADAAQCASEVEGYLRAGGWGRVGEKSCRAVMLPHAGWMFCGATMGKTLAGVKLPGTAIIVGPRHTPLGPECSVAHHGAWQIPGATVPVAAGLAQRLSGALGWLRCEGDAHREEHGTEVLLPFLVLAALGRELAAIRREAAARGEEAPLLVISSDLNHYAPEPENRRRDMMALQVMQSGDPRQLLETCMRNGISMCGVLPAATVMLALQQETPVIGPRLVDYTTSAAASGDTSRVVGYAGGVIE